MKILNVYVFLLSLTSSVSAATDQSMRNQLDQLDEQASTPRGSVQRAVTRASSVTSWATSAGSRGGDYLYKRLNKDSTKKEYANAVSELVELRRSLLRENKQTNADAISYLEEMIRLFDLIPGMIYQTEAGERQSDTLRNSLLNLIEKYKELEAELESIKTSPDSSSDAKLKAERDALRSRVDELVVEYERASDRANNYLEHLEHQEAVSRELRNKNAELQVDVDRRDQEISQLRKNNFDLQAKLDRQNQEITQLRENSSEPQNWLLTQDQELTQQPQRELSHTSSAVAVLPPREVDRGGRRAPSYMQGGRTQRSDGDDAWVRGWACSVM